VPRPCARRRELPLRAWHPTTSCEHLRIAAAATTASRARAPSQRAPAALPLCGPRVAISRSCQRNAPPARTRRRRQCTSQHLQQSLMAAQHADAVAAPLASQTCRSSLRVFNACGSPCCSNSNSNSNGDKQQRKRHREVVISVTRSRRAPRERSV
jgi:hypothetical protein